MVVYSSAEAWSCSSSLLFALTSCPFSRACMVGELESGIDLEIAEHSLARTSRGVRFTDEANASQCERSILDVR